MKQAFEKVVAVEEELERYYWLFLIIKFCRDATHPQKCSFLKGVYE
jgi:hypothetical protein